MAVPEKVAIIGKAPSSRGMAPFDDSAWEIWTLSDLVPMKQVPRFDRHFEIHPLDWFRTRGDGYFDWMAGITDKPVYLREKMPEVPSSEAFPVDEIVAKFGRYFTNTVSWMIAYAIYLEVKEIGVYGVDMAQDGEYKSQRPSCEFFLGWAAGAGIKITIPAESDLLKCRMLYGIETDGGEMRAKWLARTNELRQRGQTKRQQAEQANYEAAMIEGALEAQQYYKQWLGNPWS